MSKSVFVVTPPDKRDLGAFISFLSDLPLIGPDRVDAYSFGQVGRMHSAFWDKFDAAAKAGAESFTFSPGSFAAEVFEAPNQPRDERGRWSSTGGGGGAPQSGVDAASLANTIRSWTPGAEVGFSVRMTDGNAPTHGYMLSGYKNREWSKPAGEVTETDIRDYIGKNLDVLANPESHLGGWVSNDDGKVYLDISVRATNYDDAFTRCEQMGEQGFYDLARGTTVYVNRGREEQRP